MKIAEVAQIFGLFYFEAMVSQTHLVTLAENAKVRQHLGT
jgi:hypothetical protein